MLCLIFRIANVFLLKNSTDLLLCSAQLIWISFKYAEVVIFLTLLDEIYIFEPPVIFQIEAADTVRFTDEETAF
jgi:hypothetical protein